MTRIVPVIALLLFTFGCADPNAISERAGQWETALNAGDMDALVDLYTDDARLMAPNIETLEGHDGVRNGFGPMIEAGMTASLQTSHISISNRFGHRVGTYELRDGDDVVDKGKFVETWIADSDGTWRISNDIYNSDMPVIPPHEPKRERKRKGMGHPHVMILHEVEDGEHWLNAWRGEDSRHALFKANGAKHVHTFQHPEDPNLTGLVVALEDMEALQAMLDSDEGQAAAAEDGVDMASMQVLMEVK